MSVPRKDKPLLTPIEKDRVKNPPIDPNIRKRNNIIVKRKMQYWLNDAKEVSLALDHLKESKLEGIFPDEDIFALFNLIKKLLNRLHFVPVQGDPHHPFVMWEKYGSEGYIRRARPSDLERNLQVEELVWSLINCYPFWLPKNWRIEDINGVSPAYKNYHNKKRKEAFAKRHMNLLDHEPIIDPSTAWIEKEEEPK